MDGANFLAASAGASMLCCCPLSRFHCVQHGQQGETVFHTFVCRICKIQCDNVSNKMAETWHVGRHKSWFTAVFDVSLWREWGSLGSTLIMSLGREDLSPANYVQRPKKPGSNCRTCNMYLFFLWSLQWNTVLPTTLKSMKRWLVLLCCSSSSLWSIICCCWCEIWQHFAIISPELCFCCFCMSGGQ